jgi:hypothetical protein
MEVQIARISGQERTAVLPVLGISEGSFRVISVLYWTRSAG